MDSNLRYLPGKKRSQDVFHSLYESPACHKPSHLLLQLLKLWLRKTQNASFPKILPHPLANRGGPVLAVPAQEVVLAPCLKAVAIKAVEFRLPTGSASFLDLPLKRNGLEIGKPGSPPTTPTLSCWTPTFWFKIPCIEWLPENRLATKGLSARYLATVSPSRRQQVHWTKKSTHCRSFATWDHPGTWRWLQQVL